MSSYFEENPWTVDLTKHLPPMSNSQLKRPLLTIFPNGKRCGFLHAWFRSPANRVAFVDFSVSAPLGRPADTEDAGRVARGAINYTSSAWLGRNLRQSLIKFLAVLAGQILCLSLSTRLSVAEQLGIGLPVFIPLHEPSVGGT